MTISGILLLTPFVLTSQPAKTEATKPVPKPQPVPIVQQNKAESAKLPTIVTTPTSPKPASSTLFVSPKVVATPASPFNPNANKASDLKTGASPSPASSSKVTPTVTPTAKPVLKSDTVIKAKVAPPVLKPTKAQVEERQKATDALILKKSQRAEELRIKKARYLAGATGGVMTADQTAELAQLESENTSLQTQLEQSDANLTAERNALQQREFLAPRQPSFLEQVFGLFIGLIFVGMTGGALTIALLWFSGHDPLKSVQQGKFVKRSDSEK